jgi:hypothetical protein
MIINLHSEFHQPLARSSSNVDSARTLVSASHPGTDSGAANTRTYSRSNLPAAISVYLIAPSTDGGPDHCLDSDATGFTHGLDHSTDHVGHQALPPAMGHSRQRWRIDTMAMQADHRTVSSQRNEPKPRLVGDQCVHTGIRPWAINPRDGTTVHRTDEGQTAARAEGCGKLPSVYEDRLGIVPHMVSEVPSSELALAVTTVGTGYHVARPTVVVRGNDIVSASRRLPRATESP